MIRFTRICSARLGIVLFAAIVMWSLPVHIRAETAAKYYSEGRAAEESGDNISAYIAYKKAITMKPAEIKFRVSYERIRVPAAQEYVRQGETFAKAKSFAPALADFLRALDINPSDELAEADVHMIEGIIGEQNHDAETLLARANAVKSTAPPVVLDVHANEPITLHMSEDSRIVYETLGRAVGLNVLFDPEYMSKRVQIDLKEVTVYEALDILAQVTNTFSRPVTHNSIFVAQDTRAKRLLLSQQAVQIFYLKNVSQPNDLNDIQTAIRNILPNAKIFGVASQNAVIMRGTPDELRLAEVLVQGLDQPRPEVLVDITVMEVSRDKLRKIGLSPPTSLTVNSGSSQTLNDIGKTSSYSISVGQAAVQFLLTDSDTRILQSPSLRAMDGQKATLKLGERLPIATGSYTVATGSTSAAAETQFQYIDVGVNVEMTPAIHGDRDVTLKLSVEVSAQSGTETIDSVAEPVISQQKADQTIRLKDGETTILAGLVKRQESKSASGWPGFGEIPIAKYFFTTQSREVVDDELVFMIVPHVVRTTQPDSETDHQIDTGTEAGVRLRVSASPTVLGGSGKE